MMPSISRVTSTTHICTIFFLVLRKPPTSNSMALSSLLDGKGMKLSCFYNRWSIHPGAGLSFPISPEFRINPTSTILQLETIKSLLLRFSTNRSTTGNTVSKNDKKSVISRQSILSWKQFLSRPKIFCPTFGYLSLFSSFIYFYRHLIIVLLLSLVHVFQIIVFVVSTFIITLYFM